MKATQLDTTKEGVKAYLDQAANDYKGAAKQAQHKAAVVAFVLDAIGIDDEALRKHALKQIAATPSGFGCNHSALEQALGVERKGRGGLADFLKD